MKYHEISTAASLYLQRIRPLKYEQYQWQFGIPKKFASWPNIPIRLQSLTLKRSMSDAKKKKKKNRFLVMFIDQWWENHANFFCWDPWHRPGSAFDRLEFTKKRNFLQPCANQIDGILTETCSERAKKICKMSVSSHLHCCFYCVFCCPTKRHAKTWTQRLLGFFGTTNLGFSATRTLPPARQCPRKSPPQCHQCWQIDFRWRQGKKIRCAKKTPGKRNRKILELSIVTQESQEHKHIEFLYFKLL